MSIPFLPRGVRLHWDELRKRNVLLGPERALMLDPIAHEILKRVDGQTAEATICSDLAESFGAPLDQVTGDVATFLSELADKRLVEMRND